MMAGIRIIFLKKYIAIYNSMCYNEFNGKLARIQSMEPGARSQEPGARSQEPGARSQERWKWKRRKIPRDEAFHCLRHCDRG